MRNTGTCRFGDKCNFSHTQPKSKHPCWYYNTPKGCAKSAEECTFAHVKSPGMRKPMYLQKPCTQYHLGTCTRRECTFDHEPLILSEWQTHFPDHPFQEPQVNNNLNIAGPHLLHSAPKVEPRIIVIPKVSDSVPAPTGVWGRGVPETVKAPPSAELQAQLEAEKRAREKAQQRALREEQRRIRATRIRDPNSWADVSSDTESESLDTAEVEYNRYTQTDTSTDSHSR